MYRSAVRSGALRAGRPTNLAIPRRFASTAPPTKKSTWRGTAVRWGLAIGAVYWYNTSPLFMDEVDAPPRPSPARLSGDDKQTIEALIEEKRRQIAARQPTPAPAPAPAQAEHPTQESTAQPGVPEPTASTESDGPAPGSPEALEQEAGQQGAFNPETGEINWECPCLGGMAHGPCGEEFKSAFSCFVFSEVEPKGMDCIEKFQHMQDCFRKYPEIYGSEIDDEEDGGEAPAQGDASQPEATTPQAARDATTPPQKASDVAETETPAPSALIKTPAATSTPAETENGTAQVLREKHEAKEAISAETAPRQAFDATAANKGKK